MGSTGPLRRIGREGDGGMTSSSDDGEESTRPTGRRGLESEVLLARARSRMLGMPQPATVGRYRVIERLGSGGMGVVYSARDDELDRNIAIKILRGDLQSGSGKQRLIREAQAMAKLSHPNVVHVYEVGHHGDQVFLAMEHIAGRTLRAWCEEGNRGWREIIAMHLQAGEGLAAAHDAGLVHRDYKMDNVLVGNDERPRVLDFGLARPECDASTLTDLARVEQMPIDPADISEHGGPSLTMTGVAMGTPAYMAPEQLLAERIDARVDQFAFCVSLYEALYGHRPFPGSTMTQLIAATRTDKPIAIDPRRFGVPREVHDAILRGMRRDRTERHASMTALIEALRKPLLTRTDRRQRTRFVGLAAGVLAVGIAGAIAMQREDTPVADAPPVDASQERLQSILDASDLPPLVPTPLPGDPTGVTVHRLDNGLTVYIAPQPGEPHIETKIVIRADRSDEPLGHAGLASLAISTMAMGSRRLGTLDFAAEQPYLDQQLELLDQLARTTEPAERERILAEVDAAYRASAHLVVPGEAMVVGNALGFSHMLHELHHHSVLSATVPRNRFATWAELWAEPLREPVLRGFANVVAEEVERAREDAEYTQPFFAARRHLVAADGIHSDVTTTFEHARTFPHRDVMQFLERYYRPNNTAVVLVGDITAVEALPVLERAFGSWEPAELPEKAWIDRPLPKEPIVEKITDAGPPAAVLAFPLPPAHRSDRGDFEALGNALNGQDGLLASLLVATGEASWTEAFVEDRTLFLLAMTRPESDPEQGERALRKALADIADEKIPDALWDAAIARQELEASRWAISPAALADTIAVSFAQRRAWGDVSAELGRPATREQLAATARTLLGRGAVAVHVDNGPPFRLEGDPIDVAQAPKAAAGQHSALAQQLLAQPAAELEPQFLAPGRDYQTFQYGAGRVVVAPEDSPIFRVSWTWPIGVDREPLACDALRAKVDSRHDWPGLRGLEILDSCASNISRIEVVGVEARFEEVWPALRAFLVSNELPLPNAQAHLDEVVARREQARREPYAKLEAAHALALRGEHSIDAQLPRDGAMRELDPRRLSAALERVQSVDPDIAYVGPRHQLLLDNLPPASRVDAPREPLRFRDLDRTTVFVVDAPDQPDVLMRVSAPVPRGEQSAVLAELFEQFVHGEPERMSGVAGLTVYPLGPRGLGNGRIAHHFEVRASVGDAVHGIENVLARLRRPRTADAFARAHKRAEAAYRAARSAPRLVPFELQRWIDRGWDRDPKFTNWLALASVDLGEFDRYAETVGTAPLAIVIVGDLAQLDRAALARLGRVVEIDPMDLLRDPGLSDVLVVDTIDDCNCIDE
jgi:serine/threonine protein kinase/predicted Zn-dependent peptidase